MYQPNSKVTDHNALDLDQKALEADLAETPVDYVNAKKVFQEGGHSKSYFEFTTSATTNLLKAYPKDTTTCSQNGVVVGTLKSDLSAGTGARTVQCVYSTSATQATYQSCKVGGLEASEWDKSGCMVATANIVLTNGANPDTILVADIASSSHKNGRTLEGFGTALTTNATMRDNSASCPGCPYKDYLPFDQYYGPGYGTKYVLGALDGAAVNYTTTPTAPYDKSVDFSTINDDGTRVEAAKKGSVFLNVYMYVIREFEDAIDDCTSNSLDNNFGSVHAWDEGVAFYAGSLEGIDGSGSGKMLAALADKRCQNFGTCGPDGNDDGTRYTKSKVNLDLLEQFRIGRNALIVGNCAAVRPVVDKIVSLMRVPMIQGTLRYAYKMATNGPGGSGANAAGSPTLLKENAEGATFAFAILPLLNRCNQTAAKTVYDNLKLGAGATTNKHAVKAAFEANYECLGLKCADIGALNAAGGCALNDAWCRACVDPVTAPTYEKIAGYAPRSKVTDHNAIDLDQKAMEEQIALGNWAKAKTIYVQGGNSKSYASFTVPGTDVSGAATPALSKGAKVSGLTVGSSTVTGFLKSDVAAGAKTIDVMYDTNVVQASYNGGCQVGALVANTTTGCFAPTKTLAVDWVAMTPTAVANKAARSLQVFATEATVTSKMWSGCPGCPYRTYSAFKNYYGDIDYADKWITAALDGTKHTFANKDAAGNDLVVDFATYNDAKTRGEAAKKGTAYMSALMYVIREFEDAIDDCKYDNITNTYDAAHAWDEGVAFYTGSLEGTAVGGNAAGKLAYRLAEKRCANFNTCGPTGTEATGVSKVNLDLFTLFAEGQVALTQSQCAAVRPILEKVTSKLFVPLIQGALRYAYMMSTDGPGGSGTNAAGSPTLLKQNAEGAVFAAAVVPMVANCSAADAQIIWDNLKLGAGATTNKLAVKAAFERNYACMGIKCADVGALSEAKAGDLFGTACSDPEAQALTVQVMNTGAVVGIIAACLVAVLALLCICVMIRKEKSGAPIFTNLDGKQASSSTKGVSMTPTAQSPMESPHNAA